MILRIRPRFSVRTLVIFVTLICAYFGAWEATKRNAIPKVSTLPVKSFATVESSSAPVPFVVRMNSIEPLEDFQPPKSGMFTIEVPITKTTRYYLWLFGPTFKLPFESTWE